MSVRFSRRVLVGVPLDAPFTGVLNPAIDVAFVVLLAFGVEDKGVEDCGNELKSELLPFILIAVCNIN